MVTARLMRVRAPLLRLCRLALRFVQQLLKELPRSLMRNCERRAAVKTGDIYAYHVSLQVNDRTTTLPTSNNRIVDDHRGKSGQSHAHGQITRDRDAVARVLGLNRKDHL